MVEAAVKRVLVVDDDPDVLSLLVASLEETYEVIQATNGTEAIEILKIDPKIDAVVTDIVMPGNVDGFDVAHQAKTLRPDLRVLYISGYVRNIPWGQKGIGYGPLLAKPFLPSQLNRMLAAL